MGNKVLLHVCCGVCSLSVVERLKNEGFSVEGFFYNPNIHPDDEYKKRLEAAQLVSEKLDFPLIEGEYDKDRWFALAQLFEAEPEGGERCKICFSMRLKETFLRAQRAGIEYVTTTLTVSPRKNSGLVNAVGKEVEKDTEGVKFLERDFKKNEGFKISIQKAKELDLYRQNYCGCIYSRRERSKQK